jgi:hypothetical protein
MVFAAAIAAAAWAASGAENLLAPHFRKAAEKGLPISGRVLRDGAAEVDVLAKGTVTRYRFGKEGTVTSAASPVEYDAAILSKLACGADRAASEGAQKAEAREVEVRAVMLAVEDGVAVYHVATYDANGRFYGYHRFACASGQWDGWTSAAGERDPLADK